MKTSKLYNSSLFRLLKFICLTSQVSIAKAVCVSLPQWGETVHHFATLWLPLYKTGHEKGQDVCNKGENESVLSSVAMNKLQDEQWLTEVNPTHAANMLLGTTQSEICFSRAKCTSTLLSKNLH